MHRVPYSDQLSKLFCRKWLNGQSQFFAQLICIRYAVKIQACDLCLILKKKHNSFLSSDRSFRVLKSRSIISDFNSYYMRFVSIHDFSRTVVITWFHSRLPFWKMAKRRRQGERNIRVVLPKNSITSRSRLELMQLFD